MNDEQLSVQWCIKNLGGFSNNSDYRTLHGKNVLIATPVAEQVVALVKEQGAKSVQSLCGAMDRIDFSELHEALQSIDACSFDFVFLDTRSIESSRYAEHLALLFKELMRIAVPDGAVFCAFMVGQNDRAFDVQNMFVLGDRTWLPDRDFLFDSVLSRWAIREMKNFPAIAHQTDLLLLRLVPKRPSLLLICGVSTSGKTTLSRELVKLNPGMHVSNDFLYVQLVRASRRPGGGGVAPIIAKHLGDGSGEACGKFNRALEAFPELMEEYMQHLISSIPIGLNLVSIDFDLRTASGIEAVKMHLIDAGFSVWTVRR